MIPAIDLTQQEQELLEPIQSVVGAMGGRVEGPKRMEDGESFVEVRLGGKHYCFVSLDESRSTRFIG